MRAITLACALIAMLLLALRPLPSSAQQPGDTPDLHDDHAFVAPPPGRTFAAGSTLSLRGPSQFMAGSVAVRLLLPESNGSHDPSTESWTPAQIDAVTAQVQTALDWWAAQLPLARLRFVLRVEVVPTAYEPINYGVSNEGVWISDALGRMGFPGPSHFDQAYAAADALRDELGTDWATVLFVVNSANHPTGYFADGRFAYAYINGPFLVLTSNAGAYGPNRLAPVVAHELGHTFGALDQYSAARIGCDRRSGYLDAPTANSQYSSCGTRLPSIMLEPVGAFTAGQIDASALAQLGYYDSDGDSLIDPLDTAPTLELQSRTLASGSGRPVISGSARDQAFPSTYHQDVSLNTITAVEYRVDGGPWLPTEPADGAFDSESEAFSAELPLYDGTYSVELRSRNSAGISSPAMAQQLSISWIGPQPAYALRAPAVTASRELLLELKAPTSTAGVQVSESPTFDGAEWRPYAPELAYPLGTEDGPHTLYVRFRDQFGLLSLPYLTTSVLDTRPPLGSAMRLPSDPRQLLLSAVDAGSAVKDLEVRVGAAEPVWMPYAQSVQLEAAPAEQQVTVRFRDAAGNTSPQIVANLGYRVALPLVTR